MVVDTSGVGCSNSKDKNMKQILFASVMAMGIVTAGIADGVVTETETITTVEVVEYSRNYKK